MDAEENEHAGPVPDAAPGSGQPGGGLALLAAARENVRRLIGVAGGYEAELASAAAAAEKAEKAEKSTTADARGAGHSGLTAESLREGAEAYRRVVEAARRLAEGVEKAERAGHEEPALSPAVGRRGSEQG